MTLIKNNSLVIAIAVALCAVAYILGGYTPFAGASAPPGAPTSIATTSNPTVGTSAALVFATSSCSARIITSYASALMITFSDVQGKVPTALFGHLQPASTTVAYDSGQYGCGAVRIYSFTSQAITVSDTN